jgi:hypothetical protein
MAGRPTSSSAAMPRRGRPDVVFPVAELRRADDGGLGVFQPDPVHRLAEQLAVLGHLDGLALGADHLDAELLQHAHFLQRQRGVEPGLPAHRRQKRVGAFLLDDLGHHLGRDRLDIGGVGQARIGHDRGGVRVHEDDAVALLAQRLAGLGAGIVELAGLPDDDGPRADDHDRLDVGSFRHTLADCARSSGIGPVTAARCPAPPPTDRPHGGRPSHHGRRQARAARRIGWLPFRACSRILGLCTILRGSRCPERVIDRHRTRFARSGAT